MDCSIEAPAPAGEGGAVMRLMVSMADRIRGGRFEINLTSRLKRPGGTRPTESLKERNHYRDYEK